MPAFEQSRSARIVRLGEGFGKKGAELTINNGKHLNAAASGFSLSRQFVTSALGPHWFALMASQEF